MKTVLLTGGNLGDRVKNLDRARELITEQVGQIKQVSPLMESEAWGFKTKERFLNQVLVVDTPLETEELLDRLLQIEQELGRKREKPELQRQLSAKNSVSQEKRQYVSRTMDIDILFYEERIVETPKLTLPHPRIQEREFVLAPLCEIMPEYRHPKLNRTIRELREALHRRIPQEPYSAIYTKQ